MYPKKSPLLDRYRQEDPDSTVLLGHSVGSRRNPDPLPFGFVAATDYTKVLNEAEVTRRFRPVSAEQRAKAQAAMPGAEVRPYPLVAESPLVRSAASGFTAGVASVPEVVTGDYRTDATEIAQRSGEVNTMSKPRSLEETWIEYATSSQVTGSDSRGGVASGPPAPVRSSTPDPFFMDPPIHGGSKGRISRRECIAGIAATLAVVIGIVLIVANL